MISEFLSFFNTLPRWDYLTLLGLFIFWAIVFTLIAIILLKVLSQIAGRTKTDLDDKILEKIKTPVQIFALVSAAYFAVKYSFPDSWILGLSISDLYAIIFYVILAFTINRVVDVFLIWYGKEIIPTKESKSDAEVYPFVRNVVKIAIFSIFIVFILEKLGIAIAPLLAGLGIAGLAVGLALQDTLSNFFAGIHILTDKPFKEGDFIALDSTMGGGIAVSGAIENIGWRSTRIKTPDNNYIIVPNAKLAQSLIINYYAPNQKSQIVAEIGVSYDVDVDLVEKTILDTIRYVQDVNENMSKTDDPWVRLDRFADFSIIFKYGYYVTRFDKRFEVSKQLNKELFKVFKKNGIEIPYPVRTVINRGSPQNSYEQTQSSPSQIVVNVPQQPVQVIHTQPVVVPEKPKEEIRKEDAPLEAEKKDSSSDQTTDEKPEIESAYELLKKYERKAKEENIPETEPIEEKQDAQNEEPEILGTENHTDTIPEEVPEEQDPEESDAEFLEQLDKKNAGKFVFEGHVSKEELEPAPRDGPIFEGLNPEVRKELKKKEKPKKDSEDDKSSKKSSKKDSQRKLKFLDNLRKKITSDEEE